MSKIMITGVNGFVGGHLARELAHQGWDLVGVGHEPRVTPQLQGIVTEYYICDLTDGAAVAKLPTKQVKAVINLAGLAAVGRSFDEPDLYMNVNVAVLSTLCQAIRKLDKKDTRIIAISSGAVYTAGQPMPLTENSITDSSSSPYAASKLAMEETAQAFRDDGFDCVIARPFNHIGPGQAAGFLLPDLYTKIRSGAGAEIKVGNLETQRDYTDVRDVARAYAALASQDSLGQSVYNICSGRPVSGMFLLDTLKEACGRPDLRTVVDKSLFRPSDSPILYGDNSRLTQATGWQPSIPLEQTIRDYINWRNSPGANEKD